MPEKLELKWEWPADRVIDNRLLVQIDSLKEQSSGFFGVKKSPSLVAGFPDPYEIEGQVLDSTSGIPHKAIKLIAPVLELKGLKKGSLAMFGLVENSTCICIVEVADRNVDLREIACAK